MRLLARPRRRVRFCLLALAAWMVHAMWMFMLLRPALSGHWRPAEDESRWIDIVSYGGVLVIVAVVVLAVRDGARAGNPSARIAGGNSG